MSTKKKINVKKILLFILINILVIGLILFFISGRPQLAGISRIELVSKSDSMIDVRIDVILKNPNMFSISGENIDIKLQSDAREFANGTLDKVSIASGETDTVSVKMHVNSNALMDLFGKKDADKMSSTIVLNGTFSPLFFVHEITFDAGMPKEDIQQLLVESFFADNSIKFDSLVYKPAGPFESNLEFNIKLNNAFNFDFGVSKLEADIYPNDSSETLLGQWKLKKSVDLKPLSPVSFPGTLAVHHFSIMKAGVEKGGKNLNSAFISGSLVITMNGRSFEVPFGVPVSIDISTLKIAIKKR